MDLINTAATSFHSFFLIHFLFCSTIAMKYIQKILEGCTQLFITYITLGRKWAGQSLQVQVFTLFFDSFLNLLYYSYKTCLQIFERLHPAYPICLQENQLEK